MGGKEDSNRANPIFLFCRKFQCFIVPIITQKHKIKTKQKRPALSVESVLMDQPKPTMFEACSCLKGTVIHLLPHLVHSLPKTYFYNGSMVICLPKHVLSTAMVAVGNQGLQKKVRGSTPRFFEPPQHYRTIKFNATQFNAKHFTVGQLIIRSIQSNQAKTMCSNRWGKMW